MKLHDDRKDVKAYELTEKQKWSLVAVSIDYVDNIYDASLEREKIGGNDVNSRESQTYDSLSDRGLICGIDRSSKLDLDYTEYGKELAREIAMDFIKKGKLDADDVDFEWDSEERTEIMASMI